MVVVVVVLKRPRAGNKLFARGLLKRSLAETPPAVVGEAAEGEAFAWMFNAGGRLKVRLGLGVVLVVVVVVGTRLEAVLRPAIGLGRKRPIRGFFAVVVSASLTSSCASASVASVDDSVLSSDGASVVGLNALVLRIFSVRVAEIPPKLEDLNRLIRELGEEKPPGLC